MGNQEVEMRVIIENRSSVDMDTAIDLVRRVIAKGRISNYGKQYCYASSFNVCLDNIENNIMVVTDLNKCSDRFVVQDEYTTRD